MDSGRYRSVKVSIMLGEPADDPFGEGQEATFEEARGVGEGVNLAMVLAKAFHELKHPTKLELLTEVIHYLTDWNDFVADRPKLIEDAECAVLEAVDSLNRLWWRLEPGER